MFTAVMLSMTLGAEPGVMEMEEARASVAKALRSMAIDSVKPSPRLVGNVVTMTTRPPVGHTHTCANGHTWDHKDYSGHDCPICGLHQSMQDSRPRMVTVKTPALVATTAEGPITYALAPQSFGACANGSCAAPTRNVSAWYPGKLLGR